jgi:S-adenosylmethionine decarboxylase
MILTLNIVDGSAYLVGKTNADHWYLYLTAPKENCLRHVTTLDGQMEGDLLSNPHCPFKSMAADASTLDALVKVEKPQSSEQTFQPEDDQTVEILMTDLDRHAAQIFYHRSGEPAGHEGGARTDAATGLDKLYQGAQIDSYLFSPCGYSLNALYEESYVTVHVTPEAGYSYASFETNLPLTGGDRAVSQLVRQVVDIFRPGKFSVTVFKSQEHASTRPAEETVSAKLPSASRLGDALEEWRLTDRIVYEFEGYHFGFASFEHQ